jgi:Transposase DDE domain group 1
MPASKAEQVLEAIRALLETVPGASVERNSVLPEKIPDGGLIILRDGQPGEPEQALGGFGNAYYQHAVEVEVYVEEGDAAARDAAFDDLLQQLGIALEADPTLGGVAFGLTYGRPEPSIEPVAGAPAVKTATLTVTVRGTAEQWIKEGKKALRWTRLSCHAFRHNAVRLQLHALAYNLANFCARWPCRRTSSTGHSRRCATSW